AGPRREGDERHRREEHREIRLAPPHRAPERVDQVDHVEVHDPGDGRADERVEERPRADTAHAEHRSRLARVATAHHSRGPAERTKRRSAGRYTMPRPRGAAGFGNAQAIAAATRPGTTLAICPAKPRMQTNAEAFALARGRTPSPVHASSGTTRNATACASV